LSSDAPADAAVVMGATVFRDRPSPVFRERINHAIDLYQEGMVEYALSSPTPTSRYQSFGRRARFLVREVYSYGAYLLKIYKCS
jgi:vancomycin permeability regulator SanA